jgi:hypothetical protein
MQQHTGRAGIVSNFAISLFQAWNLMIGMPSFRVSGWLSLYGPHSYRKSHRMPLHSNLRVYETIIVYGPAFHVTHFESRITHLLYTARNTTEHG